MKPITPNKTIPAIAPGDIPLLLLTSALPSLSFGVFVLPGALAPVNKMKKGQNYYNLPILDFAIMGCTLYLR